MIDLKPACRGMVELLRHVTDDQLAGPTPCDEYTVGDLVDHVDQVSCGSILLVQPDLDAVHRPISSFAPRVGADWRDEVAGHVRVLGDAWDDPAAWEGAADVAGSDLSKEMWGKITLTELVVHGWDIARATGQAFDLPVPTLQACLDHVAAFVPNAPVPGLWGPPVDVSPDAPLLVRIVAITGRTP